MANWEIVLGYSLSLFVGIFFLRSFINAIIHYQINKSAYRKRREGQNFIDWFLYRRFKDEIPHFFRILYTTFLIVPFVGIFLSLLNNCFFGQSEVTRTIFKVFWRSEEAFIILLFLLFRGRGGKLKISRWIEKRRGQNKKE